MPADDFIDVRLAYGKEGLSVRLPRDRTTVIQPTYVPGLPDQLGALQTALRNPMGTKPLRQLVQPGKPLPSPFAISQGQCQAGLYYPQFWRSLATYRATT